MLQAWNSSVRACALLARDLPSVDAFPKDERPDSFVTISVLDAEAGRPCESETWENEKDPEFAFCCELQKV